MGNHTPTYQHLTFIILFYTSLGTSFSMQSQMRVSGFIITESGEPLVGTTILEKGITNGTISDIDGSFQLDVQSSHSKIVVSFVGFSTQELNARGEMIITMVEDLTEIECPVFIKMADLDLSYDVINSALGFAYDRYLPRLSSTPRIEYRRSVDTRQYWKASNTFHRVGRIRNSWGQFLELDVSYENIDLDNTAENNNLQRFIISPNLVLDNWILHVGYVHQKEISFG